MSWTTLYLILFFSGMAVSVMGTVLILRFVGTRFGADSPDTFRKHHDRETSRLGGFPIFLTFLIGSVWLATSQNSFVTEWLGVIVCSSAIFLLGFVDDIRPLGAKVKLVGQIVVALLACAFHLSVDKITNPISGGSIDLPLAIGVAVTVFWLVAIPNLINLIDGMDGLSSGIGMFLCLTLGVISALAGDVQAGMLALIVGGALLGFLTFNFPPAKIFLGDGGAYFIGFFIAAVSLKTSSKGSVAAALLVVAVALGIPLLDTLFALLRRAIRGVPLFQADAEHVHHRMLAMGFTKGTSLLILYAICAVLSIGGLSLFWTRGYAIPIGGAALVVLGVTAARLLGYVENLKGVRGQFSKAMRHRADVRNATRLGEALSLEAYQCPDPATFWSHYDETLEKVGLSRDSDSLSAPVHLTSDPDIYREECADCKNWTAIANAMKPAYAAAVGRFGS